MNDVGQALVLLLSVLTVLFDAPIIAFQLVEILRHIRSADGRQEYRLVIVSILLQATVIIVWRTLIWVDVTMLQQTWLGRTVDRWRLDLSIGVVLFALSLWPLWIFCRDRVRARRARVEG